MSTVVEIANLALTLLGESRIMALTDNSKPAREINAVVDQTRDALLAGYNWSFAKTRAQLPASTDVPAFEYARKFPLPVDCLRLTFVSDYYVGLDLTDYRGGPTELFTIEGRDILTNEGAPLNVKYIKRITDSTNFSANFSYSFAAKLAEALAETLTQSDTKRARAAEMFAKEIRLAVRAGAIELPPQKLADDEWVMSRL
jgi:hypothetical protein